MTAPNLTLVAFHGSQKPQPLQKLLSEVLSALGSSTAFERYTMTQMHATLIGMEADLIDGHLYGRWFKTNRQELREVSVDRFHRVMKEFVAANEPLFAIRFGGFPESYCTCRTDRRGARGDWPCATAPQELGAFHSCDRTQYEGSFYAATPGPAMITGWPVANAEEPHAFTHGLYAFRRSLEQAGLADKYHYDAHHEKAHWKNDDCFIRIGSFREPLPADALREIQHRMRTYFANMEPVIVDVTPADVAIVSYVNPSLHERDVLARIPLPAFLDDPASLQRLYGAAPG
jgi:hypothetical protein